MDFKILTTKDIPFTPGLERHSQEIPFQLEVDDFPA